jgi:hypothetical protein
MKTRYVDLNSLLQAANLLVAGLLVYVIWRGDSLPPNDYMDSFSVVLGLLLCAQTACALWIERRRRDPFFLLLAAWMILYFQFRVYTLAMLPFSLVFDRFPYAPADSNVALVYILIANLCLYGGFYAVRFRGNLRMDTRDMRGGAPAGVVLLLLVSILFMYSSGTFWTEDNLPRALIFVSTFLGSQMVILMAMTYLLLFHRSLPRVFVFAIGGLILLEMVAHTLWGSRSAIMGFAQFLLIAALAVLGTLRFARRTVILGILLLPLAVVVLVITFTISSYNRIARAGANSLEVGRALAAASESADELGDSPLVDVLLPPIASRAGYFDFAAEIIAHREQYASVVNPAAYGRSIIDNILTPGFDLFDQPKTSNALRFIYLDSGAPSKTIVQQEYHSDQLDLYGEMFGLFGYFSLALLPLIAIAFKSFYVKISDPNPFRAGVKRAVVLLCFIHFIDSFGIDWLVAEMIPYVVAIFLFSVLFTVRRARQDPSQPPAALPTTEMIGSH